MTIIRSKFDEALLVTIDRPPVNALHLDAIAALERAFAAAKDAVPRNGIVLTGGSRRGSIRAFVSYGRDQRRAMARAITRMVARLLAIPVPVCTENSNPDIVVMESAQDRKRCDVPGPLNRPRDRRILI